MWGTVFIPSDSCDESHIRRLLQEIRCDSDDLCVLAHFGWHEVADTGILAREFDGELLLGIHGAGYDFYDAHWSRLYDALEYQWHTQ
jgi:hypothetical protein